VGGNAQYRVLQHQRIQGNAHGGNGCEWTQVEASGGAQIYFAHDVGRPRIIDEFGPQRVVKSDRPGRISPFGGFASNGRSASGRPIATILNGTAYTDVGRWQQLQITVFLRC